MILISKRTRKIGFQVVLIHPLSGFQVFSCMTDGIAVFDDVLSLRSIVDKNFVACRRVLQKGDRLAVHFNGFAFGKWA